MEVLQLDESADVEAVARELENDPNVELAEPNYVITAANDPHFDLQWGLKNTAQPMFGVRGVAGRDINITPARQIAQGSPEIIVAVIDSGIDAQHPDLQNNIFVNENETPDGFDNDNNGYIDDVSGWNFCDNNNQLMSDYDDTLHGTHVSGIIAAGINQIGVEGVAPQVKILPLKFLKNNEGYTSDAILAIQYAEQMGASIVNCSWGSSGASSALREVMQQSNMLFVCAAGNYSEDASIDGHYPANFELDNNISVAAMDNTGQLADFSNYGGNITIAAPGKDIYSTAPQNNYAFMNGTSMAAPFVAGAAALLQSSQPDLSAGEIKAQIRDSATFSSTFTGKVEANGYLNAGAALSGASASELAVQNNAYGGQLAYADGFAYTMGGFVDGAYSAALRYYSPIHKTWYQRPAMNTARMHHGAAGVNSELFVIGGYNGTVLDTVEKYDTITQTWSAAASLPEPLFASGVCSVGEQIYVFGGVNETKSEFSQSVYVYDTIRDEWAAKQDMPFAAAYQCVAAVGGKIYLMGGIDQNGSRYSIYEYSIQDDTWEQKTTMHTARHNAAVAQCNGKLYIMGGSNDSSFDIQKQLQAGQDSTYQIHTALRTVEEYDPVTNTCSQLPDMPNTRLSFSIMNQDNTLVITGGWDTTGAGDVTYLYSVYPHKLNAVSSENGLVIRWEKADQASEYELEINGEIIAIQQADTLSYTLQQADDLHEIRIRAIFEDMPGIWSPYIYKQRYDRMEDGKTIDLSETGYAAMEERITDRLLWFRLPIRISGTLDASVTAEAAVSIEIYDSAGNFIAGSQPDGTGKECISDMPVTSSIYYIKAVTQAGTADFSLQIQHTPIDTSEIPDRVFANTIEKANLRDDPSVQGSNGRKAVELIPTPVQIAGGKRDAQQIDSPDIGAQSTLSVDMNQLRTEHVWQTTGVLRSSTDKDVYTISKLEPGEKLTAVVDAPGASEYKVFIYKRLSGDSAFTWVDLFENPERRSISEIVTTVGASYTIEVFPRVGHGSSSPYQLTVYLSSPDQFEPNFCPEIDLDTLSGVGNGSTRAVQRSQLTLDTQFDKDYYNLGAIPPGEKVTLEIDLLGDFSNKAEDFDFELWTLKNKIPVGGEWYEYYYNTYGYQNEAAEKLYSSDSVKTRALSFVTRELTDDGQSPNYYIVVRSKNRSHSVLPTDQYRLTCTRVPVEAQASNDPYELEWSSSNMTNDFILVNDLETASWCNWSAPVKAKMDNQLDIDWYRVEATAAGEEKTFALDGNTFAKSNYRLVLFDSHMQLAKAGTQTLSYTFSTKGVYYLGVYAANWSVNAADQNYTLSLASQSSPGLQLNTSTITYNTGVSGVTAEPALGYTNKISFDIKQNGFNSTTLYAEAWIGWDSNELYRKAGKTFTLSGTGYHTVELDNISLYGGHGEDVYTQIRIYSSDAANKLLLLESPAVVHSKSNRLLPSDLRLLKQPGGHMLYVNNPETITDADVIKRIRVADEAPNHLIYQQSGLTGENTLYVTQSVKDGADAPEDLIYYDVDFYNPSNDPVTVWITQPYHRNTNDYSGLKNLYLERLWEDHPAKEIVIPAWGHRLLFRDMMPNEFGKPGSLTLSQWTYIGLYVDFEVLGGRNLTLSTLAAYDTDCLNLSYDDYGNLSAGTGDNKVAVKGAPLIIAERDTEKDSYMKMKGIADDSLSAVTGELQYVVDDQTPNGNLPINIADDFYASEFPCPEDVWMTSINPINDRYLAKLHALPSSLLSYEYEDGDKTWMFDFKYLNQKSTLGMSAGLETVSEASGYYNRKLNQNVIQYYQDVALNPNEPLPYEDIMDFSENEVGNARYSDWENNTMVIGNWGVKYVYTIDIMNSGNNMRTLNYYMKFANFIGATYVVRDADTGAVVPVNGNLYNGEAFESPKDAAGEHIRTEQQLFSIDIPSGAHYTITMQTLNGVGVGGFENRLELGR